MQVCRAVGFVVPKNIFASQVFTLDWDILQKGELALRNRSALKCERLHCDLNMHLFESLRLIKRSVVIEKLIELIGCN